jgi:N-acetylated-alpha-linked acidic dipeptidase
MLLNESLILCKYGKVFRGNKIKMAEKYGAGGVLLYDDPYRSVPSDLGIYPEGQYLPDQGTQRGTIFVKGS